MKIFIRYGRPPGQTWTPLARSTIRYTLYYNVDEPRRMVEEALYR
jgi:hypothetical protein